MARGLYRLASYSLGKKLGLIPESFTFFISNLDLLQKSLSGNFSLKLRGVIETWKEGRKEKERRNDNVVYSTSTILRVKVLEETTGTLKVSN